MNKVDIGFVEECEYWRLESRFFPSKVGGRPAWLNLKNLPTFDDLKCNACDDPCIFLCQVYAPYEEDPRAFHRTLFVFVCKNHLCHKPNSNDGFKILRGQLPRDNMFYPFEPPEEREDWKPDIRAEKWSKTCNVCGILAPKYCAKCKNANYCCRNHQVQDWKILHKEQCNADSPEEKKTLRKVDELRGILFPEFEIVTEPENSEEAENDYDEATREKEELEKFESLVQSGKAGTLQTVNDIDDDLLNMSQVDSDEVFTKFTERIKEHPDQILRYDRGGKPLFVSSCNQQLNIPNCEQCNGPRQLEFQIMPQLLNCLGFKDVLKSLDWGTLLIFTCKNSCPPKLGYNAEYIWKQDISQETLSDKKTIK